jgi:hypothetical protein
MDQSLAARQHEVLATLAEAETDANALRCLGLPEAKVYNSFDELRAEVDRAGRKGGYEVSIKRSKPHKKQLLCGRAGEPDTRDKGHVHESKQRRTGSKKCGCPFELKATNVKDKATGEYSGRWELEVTKNDKHNHDGIDASGLVRHRVAALTDHQRENIEVLVAGGVSTKHIKYNHMTSGLPEGAVRVDITSKDIANIRKKRRAVGLEGLTPIMALLKVCLL